MNSIAFGDRLRQLARRPALPAGLILLLVVVAVFGNSLRNGFVWDDDIYIVNNPVYRSFDLKRIFTSLANGLEYLPVRDLSYAIDHRIGGGSPAIFHATNVLIYFLTVLCTCFYARLTYRLLFPATSGEPDRRSLAAGFATALLFAVHPIHSEVANFITCRNALLSTMFFFLAAALFLRFLTAQRSSTAATAYAAALVCFLLSLFSKANSIILPLILLLHLPSLPRERRLRGGLATIPFFATAIASFFLLTTIAARSHIITDRMEDWTLNGSITKVVKAVQYVQFYLWKLLYPYGFSAAYDNTFAWSPASPVALVTAAGILATLALSFYFRARAPYLFFGVCWYLAALIPVLNFFSTNPPISDRYAFLPSFAFFFILAAAGMQLAARIKPAWPATAGLIVAIFWSSLAIARNQVWYSEETLWQDTVRTSPGSPVGFRNLGNIYLGKWEYDKALAIFDAIKDTDPTYYHTKGFVALSRGDLQEAADNFKKALGRNPQFIGSLYHLGLTYERLGQPETAAAYYAQTLRSSDPDVSNLKAKAMDRLKAFSDGH